jgi:hypothetical protein
MLVIASSSATLKSAATGTTIPSTLLHEWDRPDPYRLHRKPNSGEGYKMVTPMSQGLPGTPPDMGADFALFYQGKQDKDQVASEAGGDWDHRDPDDPFSGRQRSEGETEYGVGQQDMGWASLSSPVSRGRRAFERDSDAGSIQELLRKKHIR